jgi:putative hemolysin
MKRRISIFSALFIAVLTVSGCVSSQQASPQNPTLAETPAYLKCVNDGGQDRAVFGANGQIELCLFSDGSVCEQAAYYNGVCKKGGCMRSCGAIGTRSEGWYDCNDKLLFWDSCANETAATAGKC